MHNLDWSDLRYIVAVARSGSAAAAARSLGISHSTVVRRIQTFESTHNIRIFDHLSSGYRLTEKGEIFLEAAIAIDTAVSDLKRKIVGGQDDLTGNIRITTPDGLYPVLLDVLVDFHRFYPNITVDLNISNHRLNLKNMDADIAFRPSPHSTPNLVSVEVSTLAFSIYGKETLIRNGKFRNIHKAPWIGLGAPLTESPPARWLREFISIELVKMRCNSFVAAQGLAEQGVGYAILPCYLADRSSKIQRVVAEPMNISTKIWLIAHSDILRAKRVLICMNYLENKFKDMRSLFEGNLLVDNRVTTTIETP